MARRRAGPSSWSGFHRLPANERLQRVADHAGLGDDDVAALHAASALPDDLASAFIENAVGAFPLPLGFAVGFVVDGADIVVPMAVEESSVVAGASHGAKMAAAGGGFTTWADEPITIGQIEVRDVADTAAALAAIAGRRERWRDALDAAMPGMVERGGGVRDITARRVGDARVVVHLHVDTRDAMGANVVNGLCETLAPDVADTAGGRPGVRILSNLATGRMAGASFDVPVEAVGGADVAAAIVQADAFARADPYRAATHNKGILNGMDPVAVATGNDWRALEAGAHAFACRDGAYRGLTRYETARGRMTARLELPVQVGTAGGVTRLHPVARACLRVLGDPDARGLARILSAVGLAQNLAALRALSAEGIQAGHMRLHASNRALQEAQEEGRSKK